MQARRSDMGDDAERLHIHLPDHEATVELGRRLGGLIERRAIVALTGTIGAGKTTMVQGMARGLDVVELVSSPTFTMMNEYHSGRLPLYHLDLYRVQDSPEFRQVLDLIAAELDELVASDGVIVVEWAELFNGEEGASLRAGEDYLSGRDHLQVELSYGIARSRVIEGGKSENVSHDLVKDINKDGGRTAVVSACGREAAILLSGLAYG